MDTDNTTSQDQQEQEQKQAAQTTKMEDEHNSYQHLELILDVPLQVSAELGRSKVLIKELLQLREGSVIELDKLAGEPLDVYVNSRLIARAEAVIVNEKVGLRLTDVVSPSERLEKLG
ncbi:MAG: flagellar motor switch protein FliN [Desulfovermiculus sp.]